MKKNLLIAIIGIGFLASCNTNNHYKSYDDYPVYDGNDLELVYSQQSSKFRVWAPTADEVRILLYDNGNEGGAYKTVGMKRSENGTWQKEIDENLKGKFYTFQVRIGERWIDETPGLWVKAVGLNGRRAAIIDMNETNPDGWSMDERPIERNVTDMVIYGLNVHDFSASPNSGIRHKGQYLAFTEHGTKNTFGQSTGIDHLKELGITHVQLQLPLDAPAESSFNSKNSAPTGNNLSFNVPDGRYSTNQTDPKCRIKEFKQMVMSLHKAGMRVILNVDYNKILKTQKSHFELLVPGYFYRQNADSTLSNATGYGSELATERPMVRKFIVESVVNWATEYHIDGFCFNQMGAYDVETMNEIRAALDKIDPTIFVYGEGFTVGKSSLSDEKRALKNNMSQMDRIAVYSDDFNNILEGHGSLAGYVFGVDSLEESLKFCIVGGVKHDSIDYSKMIYSKSPYVNEPYQTVNYAAITSKFNLDNDSVGSSIPVAFSDEEAKRFDMFAKTILFTSQGIPFINAGDEFLQNKSDLRVATHDSLKVINWNNKSTYSDLFEFYKNLITLRKQHSSFRLQATDLINSNLEFVKAGTPKVVAYLLKNHVNGDEWKDVLVVLNANRYPVSVKIPEGQWMLVCHDGQINLKGINTAGYGFISVPGSSASVMYQ